MVRPPDFFGADGPEAAQLVWRMEAAMNKAALMVMSIVFLLPALLLAQPLELPRGTEITVKLGAGTSFPKGTKLNGTAVSGGREGLRFYVPDRGIFYVKWTHIDSINGIPINDVPEAQSRPAPQETAPQGNVQAPAPVEYVPASAYPVPTASPINRNVLGKDSAPRRKWDSARDDDPSDQTNGHFFVSVDYFGTGNAANNPKVRAQEFQTDLQTVYTKTETVGTYNATGGWGVTAGYLAPIKEYLDVGGSLSYIAGPNYTYIIGAENETDSTDSSVVTAAGSVSYLRLLALSRLNLPINRDWGMHLILGIGPALGWQRETQDIESTNAAVCEKWEIPSGVRVERNYNFSASALAWQVGPSISYGKWELELGAAGLPRISGSENFESVKMHSWTTFEANLRYSF